MKGPDEAACQMVTKQGRLKKSFQRVNTKAARKTPQLYKTENPKGAMESINEKNSAHKLYIPNHRPQRNKT
jgi:hypothetical protein